MQVEGVYEELVAIWREAHLIGTCGSVLEWDQQTRMPARSAEYRSQQLALLAGLRHERITRPRIGELLGELEGSPLVEDGDSATAVNVREIRRDYDKATKLPQSLVEELARTTSQAQHAWVGARRAKDFGQFLPWLQKVFELTRQKAAALDPTSGAYDVLLDDYEPGAKADAIATLFRGLREELVSLVSEIGAARRQPDVGILARSYPVDRQCMFSEMVASELGYDFSRGQLDVTTHPFCTSLGPHDCRILTRYNPRQFNEAFFGVLHEAGHGLYEQGLDPEAFGTPMGEAVSLGVHESQSRLWENGIGRSLAFWQHYFPKARGVFREALGDVSLEAFHFAVNKVSPSFIRVEADEVTYNLHILIRFELEQALISEDLSPEGLPSAWNEKYEKYLGILPGDDAVGCLQDVHWSHGLIGYFPTYTLGNVYGAQFFQKAGEELGDLDGMMQRGEFDVLLGWLRERIHRHGRRYDANRLVEVVTGGPAEASALVASLRNKFSPLYEL